MATTDDDAIRVSLGRVVVCAHAASAGSDQPTKLVPGTITPFHVDRRPYTVFAHAVNEIFGARSLRKRLGRPPRHLGSWAPMPLFGIGSLAAAHAEWGNRRGPGYRKVDVRPVPERQCLIGIGHRARPGAARARRMRASLHAPWVSTLVRAARLPSAITYWRRSVRAEAPAQRMQKHAPNVYRHPRARSARDGGAVPWPLVRRWCCAQNRPDRPSLPSGHPSDESILVVDEARDGAFAHLRGQTPAGANIEATSRHRFERSR